MHTHRPYSSIIELIHIDDIGIKLTRCYILRVFFPLNIRLVHFNKLLLL